MIKDKFINKDNLEVTDLEIKCLLEDNYNLEVPDEISIGIDVVLSEICKDSKHKSHRKVNRISYKVAIITAIIISITVVTSIINPQFVRAMPVVGRIFDFFGGEMINTLKDNSLLIGMTAKDKGITVTLEEVSMDSQKFMATLKVTGNTFNDDAVDVEVGGRVNNSNFNTYSSSTKRINDTTLVVLFEGNLSDITVNDKVNLELYIGGIIIDGKEINGDWSFSAKVDKNEILIASTELHPLEEASIGNYKVSVDKCFTSALGTKIDIKCIFNDYDPVTKSEEDNLKAADELFTVGYIFKDSLGNTLLSKEVENKTDLNTMERVLRAEVIGDLSYSDYIDVIPVLMGKAEVSYYDDEGNMLYKCIGDSNSDSFKIITIGKENYSMPNNNQFFTLEELKGKTIEVNNTDKVMIKDLEVADNYTKVIFKINDYYDLRFLGFMDIIDEDFNIYRNESFNLGTIVEDSKGKEVSLTLPPLDKSKKYTIALPRILDLNIDEANKIRVNLK